MFNAKSQLILIMLDKIEIFIKTFDERKCVGCGKNCERENVMEKVKYFLEETYDILSAHQEENHCLVIFNKEEEKWKVANTSFRQYSHDWMDSISEISEEQASK